MKSADGNSGFDNGFQSADEGDVESGVQSDARGRVHNKNKFIMYLYERTTRISTGMSLISATLYGTSVLMTGVYNRLFGAVIAILTNIVGVVFNKMQTKEQEDECRNMSRVEYICTRAAHSIQPHKYTRQSVALGILLTGIPIGVAGIESKRYSEIASMGNMLVSALCLGLPVQDLNGWVLLAAWSLPTYGGVTIYSSVLTAQEGDWLSFTSGVVGVLGTSIMPLVINGLVRKDDIREAEGWRNKLKVLFVGVDPGREV